MKYDHNKNQLVSSTAEIPVVATIKDLGLFTTAGNLDTSIDAFGRARISTPYTLFDSALRYDDQRQKWNTANTGSSSATHNANGSFMSMQVGTFSGDSVIRESRRVMPYQPGKSLHTLQSFVMGTGKQNVCQRAGFFSTTNGIYFETANNMAYIVKRSSVSGTVVEERVPQTDWNINKFDGGNYNFIKANMNFDKSQIFWTDIEWLGVGSVRTGFLYNGYLIPAHAFHHANKEPSTYMTTATLPLRYEIFNTGVTDSPTELKQICATVMSEGGYEAKSGQWGITRTVPITSNSVATGWAPIVSLKLASGREDSVVLPDTVSVTGDGTSAIYEWALWKNATVTGGKWFVHESNSVQYNSNANTMTTTTAIRLNGGIFTSANKVDGVINSGVDYNYEFQLGRDLNANSDSVTLAVRHIAVGGTVYGILNFLDLT
jgi:hypothetical protein